MRDGSPLAERYADVDRLDFPRGHFADEDGCIFLLGDVDFELGEETAGSRDRPDVGGKLGEGPLRKLPCWRDEGRLLPPLGRCFLLPGDHFPVAGELGRGAGREQR